MLYGLILLFVGGLIYTSENLNFSMEKWEIDTFLEASRLWIKCDGGLSRALKVTHDTTHECMNFNPNVTTRSNSNMKIRALERAKMVVVKCKNMQIRNSGTVSGINLMAMLFGRRKRILPSYLIEIGFHLIL